MNCLRGRFRTVLVGLGALCTATAGILTSGIAANLTKCDDTVNVSVCNNNDAATHNCCVATFLIFWKYRQFDNCDVLETLHNGVYYYSDRSNGTMHDPETACTPTTNTCPPC